MSAIPAVLDALVAVLRDAPALAGVQVLDGQPVVETEPDVIAVGFSPERVAVEGTDAVAGLNTEREAFDVVGLASSWRGDPDIKVVRDRAFALLSAITSTLKANPRLDGTCALARVSVLAYAQEQTDKGPVATVEFQVHVEAFR